MVQSSGTAQNLAAEDTTGETYGPDGDGAVDAVDAFLQQTGADVHRRALFNAEAAKGCGAGTFEGIDADGNAYTVTIRNFVPPNGDHAMAFVAWMREQITAKDFDADELNDYHDSGFPISFNVTFEDEAGDEIESIDYELGHHDGFEWHGAQELFEAVKSDDHPRAFRLAMDHIETAIENHRDQLALAAADDY